MQEENSGLNDILLDKSSSNGNTKKIVLAVAVLLIVAIIVIVLMKGLSSDSSNNLPQAALPPEPKESILNDDPLFEPVTVIEDNSEESSNLDKIAQKLKQESLQENDTAPVVVEEEDVLVVQEAPKKVAEPVTKTVTPKSTISVNYYIQVGSFSKYEPDDKFLKKITGNGYKFMYHKVEIKGKVINKVLIGPFTNEKDARNALGGIKKTIEPGAFLTKV
jgi:DedD protein